MRQQRALSRAQLARKGRARPPASAASVRLHTYWRDERGRRASLPVGRGSVRRLRADIKLNEWSTSRENDDNRVQYVPSPASACPRQVLRQRVYDKLSSLPDQWKKMNNRSVITHRRISPLIPRSLPAGARASRSISQKPAPQPRALEASHRHRQSKKQ